MEQLILRNVTKRLGGRTVLNDITLTFDAGGTYGLYGENGSGKTMLFRAIAGLVRIDGGEIRVFGKAIGRDVSFPESLGLTIENVGFWPSLTGAECLEALRRIKNTVPRSAVGRALERVGLDPGDSRKYSQYSLGMKQKLAIAQAIMEEPKLLILDEPWNGLDAAAEAALSVILSEARGHGALTLVSSHDLNRLGDLCSSVARVKEGAIV